MMLRPYDLLARLSSPKLLDLVICMKYVGRVFLEMRVLNHLQPFAICNFENETLSKIVNEFLKNTDQKLSSPEKEGIPIRNSDQNFVLHSLL